MDYAATHSGDGWVAFAAALAEGCGASAFARKQDLSPRPIRELGAPPRRRVTALSA